MTDNVQRKSTSLTSYRYVDDYISTSSASKSTIVGRSLVIYDSNWAPLACQQFTYVADQSTRSYSDGSGAAAGAGAVAGSGSGGSGAVAGSGAEAGSGSESSPGTSWVPSGTALAATTGGSEGESGAGDEGR